MAWTNLALLETSNGTINFASDTIKASLVKSSYVFDRDHDNYTTSVLAHVCNATGYTDKTLSTITLAQDDAGDRSTFTLNAGDVPLTWATLTATPNQTIRWLVFWDDTVANDTILWVFQLAQDVTITTQAKTIEATISGSGLVAWKKAS